MASVVPFSTMAHLLMMYVLQNKKNIETVTRANKYNKNYTNTHANKKAMHTPQLQLPTTPLVEYGPALLLSSDQATLD